MVVTTKLAGELKAYLETNLNAKVSEVAAAAGVELKAFEYFQLGWADPFSLSRYNGLLVVPDRLQVRSGEEDILFPFDLVAVISDSDLERITRGQLAAFDALYALIDEDPELGGLCFEATVVENSFYAPVSGTGLVAINHTKLNLSVDTLLA